MVGFEGASASEPIASEAALSKIAVQVVPPSVERHTPPCAVPTYTRLGLVGWTTIAVTRPLTGVEIAVVWPFGVGYVPIAAQVLNAVNGPCRPPWRSTRSVGFRRPP